jgi:uncharacterized protein YceK
MKQLVVLAMITLLLQGCGTIRTLNPEDNHIEIHYRGHKSYCESIPRVFSGTFNDACLLYGEPNYEETGSSTKSAFMMLLVDGLLSFSLDTVALPYTVTRQIEDGNILVN